MANPRYVQPSHPRLVAFELTGSCSSAHDQLSTTDSPGDLLSSPTPLRRASPSSRPPPSPGPLVSPPSPLRSHLLHWASRAHVCPPLLPVDENLFHISYEAGILEDPNTTPPRDMWKLTANPEDAPSTPEHILIEFTKGIPTKVDVLSTKKTITDPVEIFLSLNALAREHGIGRIDIVENRFIGVKSRGCYESPGATILRVAHMDLEGLTLDRNVRALRDQFITPALSNILYNGYFFSPEREFVTAAIPASQRTVNGTVRLQLYKGNVSVEGRFSDEVHSPTSSPSPSPCPALPELINSSFFASLQGLYDEKFTSMDEMGGFEPTDTSGFISQSQLHRAAACRLPLPLLTSLHPPLLHRHRVYPNQAMGQSEREFFTRFYCYIRVSSTNASHLSSSRSSRATPRSVSTPSTAPRPKRAWERRRRSWVSYRHCNRINVVLHISLGSLRRGAKRGGGGTASALSEERACASFPP